MNIFKKIYCRCFQTVFRIAIPLLPYRDPLRLNTVAALPSVLMEKKVDNLLIITDRVLNELGILEPLKTSLTEVGIKYTVYDRTVPNPTVKNVEEARALYNECGCNGIIGFGGGSSIDCAKAVGARLARPKKPIPKMKGILKVRRRIPHLTAIPTTAGTGSEITLATVITDGESGHKFPINDFSLIPRVAVTDAINTVSMPRSITATTGMDALTHAVEAFIGRSTTRGTRRDALEATRLIFENIETAYNDGNNIAAREKMLEAAYKAGRAFSKSYVGYIHAVAHSLGGMYNIPHGLANAVLMPYVLDSYGKSAYKKLHRLGMVAGVCDKKDTYEAGAKKFISAIRMMNARMNIPKKLMGIKQEDITVMAKHAAAEANPLYPVPRLLGADELEQFYYNVADWS